MSEDVTMNLNEFEAALGKWGADLSHWPEPDRSGGQNALAHVSGAATAQAEMAALERELAILRADEAASTTVPADLAARILADAVQAMPAKALRTAPKIKAASWSDRLRGFFADGPGMWRPVTACAASAVIGLWLGTAAPAAVADAAVALVASDAVMEFAMLETDDMVAMDLDWVEFEAGGGE